MTTSFLLMILLAAIVFIMGACLAAGLAHANSPPHPQSPSVTTQPQETTP